MFFLLPLSWLGFPGFPGFLLVLLTVVFTSLVGGISFLVFIPFLTIVKKINNYYRIIIFSFALLFTEVVKTLLLGVFSLGEGVDFALHWTLTSVAYFIAFPPFAVWAGPLHVYSLVVCFGYLLFLVYLAYKKEIRVFLNLSLLFVALTIFLGLGYPVKSVDESSIQKITVLPEGVSIFAHNDKNLPTDNLFIEGGYQETGDGKGNKYNVSNYFLENKKVKVVYKEFLMPFGEYMPTMFKPLAKLYLNREGNIKDYDFWKYMRFGYVEGVNESRVFEMENGLRVATLLCSEVLSFSVLTKIKQEKPDVIYLQGSYLNFNHSAYFKFFLKRWITTAEHYIGVRIILVEID